MRETRFSMCQVNACNDVPTTPVGTESVLDGFDLLTDEIRQAEVLAKFMVCSEAFASLGDDFLDYFSALSSKLSNIRTHNEGLSADMHSLLRNAPLAK